jgi:diguanylate cyclase (GGDEF)-like protein
MKLSGSSTAAPFISAIYMISFIAIAVGAFFRIQNPNYKFEQVGRMDDFDMSYKFMVMLLYPAAALVINRFVHNSYLLNEMICFMVVIVCYFVALLCIHNNMKAQRLLEREAELRSSLQNVVSIQMQEFSRLANEDSVTRLYNRQFFLEKLHKEIEQRKQSEVVFIMMIDINRFKAINDIYGHHVGDMVLKQIGERIKEWDTIGATIARYGEDEFTLFKRGEIDKNKIMAMAGSLVKYIARPITIEGNDLEISISMGISVCPTYADEGDILLHYADIAMYRAKTLGINKYVFFDPVLSEYVRKKNELGFLLEKAVKEKKFMLYYQPQFTLPGVELAGAEALIRWKDEKYGFVSPGEFIPIAEELGIIKEMDSWVRWKAFSQVAEWNNRYGISLKVGENVSPKELADDDFIPLMVKNIAVSQVDPKWTNVEITESIVLEDSERMDRIFDFFTSIGITVSVDDFGTGYSSINYLKKYPFSCIKIDKSLIEKISISESDRKIVAAIIAMSRSINMKTIAEGVETKEQADLLIEMGCDQVQSFMFGRPVPSDEFEKKYLWHLVKN